jgi:hypothetical protein
MPPTLLPGTPPVSQDERGFSALQQVNAARDIESLAMATCVAKQQELHRQQLH